MTLSAGLLLQGTAATLVMVTAPRGPESWFHRLVFNLGLGSFLVGILSPAAEIVPYDRLDRALVFEIPRVATVNGFQSLCLVLMMVALLLVGRAFTSRDYAWMTGILPSGRLRTFVSQTVYAHAYGWLQLPRVLSEADVSLRSRGIGRPLALRNLVNAERFIDSLGLWTLYLFRQIREMTTVVEFVILSRVRLADRRTPIARVMSAADWSMVGVLGFGVLVPWILACLR
jgi:hypothetical protein